MESKEVILDKKWKREAMKLIAGSYPEYVKIGDLVKKCECPEEEELMELVRWLADEHVLIVQ